MDHPFSLLLLPFLAFQNVIRVMQLIEIFELSLTSRHMFSKIKFAKKKIFPLKLTIFKEHYQIQISDYKDKGGEERNFKLNFTFGTKWKIITRTLKLNGTNVGISQKSVDHETHPGYFAPYNNDFLIVSEYLFELFHFSKIILIIRVYQISSDLLSNPLFQKCSYVSIYGTYLCNEKFSNVLEYTGPECSLYLNTSIVSYAIDLRESKIFDRTRVYIKYAKMVTIYDLFNMKCEFCILEEHNITQSDMKQFIRRWRQGTNPQLFRLRINKFETEVDWENMLKGLNYMKWDGKRRPRYFRTETTYSILEKDFKDALDFKGGSSRLASVMQTDKHFEFVVWPQ